MLNKFFFINWSQSLSKIEEVQAKGGSDYELKYLGFELTCHEFKFMTKIALKADEKVKNDAEKVKNDAKEVMNAAKEVMNAAEKSFSNELVKKLDIMGKNFDKIDNIAKDAKDAKEIAKNMEKKIDDSVKDKFWAIEENLSEWATELFKKVETIKFADDESSEKVIVLRMKNSCKFAPACVKDFFIRKSVFKTFKNAFKKIISIDEASFRYFYFI